MLEEVRAKHELHDEEGVLGVGDNELVQTHQIRMTNVREHPELLLEAIELVRAEPGERLEGKVPVAFAIVNLVHHAHAALSDPAQDLVAAGPLPLIRPAGLASERRCGRRFNHGHPNPLYSGRGSPRNRLSS